VKRIYFILILLIAVPLSFYCSEKDHVVSFLNDTFMSELYRNTSMNLLERIEDDGYFQESLTGQYSGMYCRTVGPLTLFLLELNKTELAEKLIHHVYTAMKINNMSKVPHVIGKKLNIHDGKKVLEPYWIVGRADQIDGQAHVIMAWAKLALFRGTTDFEDTTWNFFADLMDQSIQPPYLSIEENDLKSLLIYNPAFEHSRLIPSNYNLLTQCFIGSALHAMALVADKRNERKRAIKWREAENKIKKGIEKYFIRYVNGKKVYMELLLNEKNEHLPFNGMGWVCLSPIAACWQPLPDEILKNTVYEYWNTGFKLWNGLKWMPTDFWDNGEFSGQMIGKGIAWEIEYASKIEDWKRILEIFTLLKTVQYKEPIYMENSFLMDGSDKNISFLNDSLLTQMNYAAWKVVDPGNGEQATWWCWAMSRLYKKLHLPVLPDQAGNSRFIDKNYNKNQFNGLRLQFFSLNQDRDDFMIPNKPLISSAVKNLEIYNEMIDREYFALIWKGLIKIHHQENYRFFVYSQNPAELFLDEKKIWENHENGKCVVSQSVHLDSGYYPLKLIYKHVLPNEDISLYVQDNDFFGRIEVPENSFFPVFPDSNSVLPPAVKPLNASILDGDSIQIELCDNGNQYRIYYSLDGTDPGINSNLYERPFYIDTSVFLKAVSEKKNHFSDISFIRYQLLKSRMKIVLENQYKPQYQARGIYTLIDGMKGTKNHNDGKWLGFEGDDFIAYIDLFEEKTVSHIQIQFLSSQAAWIFPPKSVCFWALEPDGNYRLLFEKKCDTDNLKDHVESDIVIFSSDFEDLKTRKLKITAENLNALPEWHTGRGGKAWLFTDEIIIKSN